MRGVLDADDYDAYVALYHGRYLEYFDTTTALKAEPLSYHEMWQQQYFKGEDDYAREILTKEAMKLIAAGEKRVEIMKKWNDARLRYISEKQQLL